MSASASDLPALLGGTPVRPEGPPAWPFPDADVSAAIASAVASGAWGQYHGEHVAALESELSAFHGAPQALSCASGTLAVEVALHALRVGPGDEVVMAAYDFESNFLTVHALGAKPVLVDVHADNWQLDPANLEAAITPQTKAIICSHLHGGLVPMREVMEIARRYAVGVVEDAAQAPGAAVQGRPTGTWGDVGTLSFGGSKLLTAGRGGALLFRDSHRYQRAKLYLQRGLQQWAPLSELQAAALRPQLRRLADATQLRAERARQLAATISVPGLRPFPLQFPDSRPAYYKLGFRHDESVFALARPALVAALRAEGIALDAGFAALHIGRSPSRYRAAGSLANAAEAHHHCVVLHHPVLSLSREDIQQVADALDKTYRFRDALAERFASSRG